MIKFGRRSYVSKVVWVFDVRAVVPAHLRVPLDPAYLARLGEAMAPLLHCTIILRTDQVELRTEIRNPLSETFFFKNLAL